MTRRAGLSGGDGFAPALLLAVMLGLPLMLACVLIVRAIAVSPLESAAPLEPLEGFVESALRPDTSAVQVRVDSGEPFAVASQAAGVITSLQISVGAQIDSGDIVMEVSGSPVVAYVADAPLYRDITVGLKGKDVETAQRFLVATGYLRAVDGVAGPATG